MDLNIIALCARNFHSAHAYVLADAMVQVHYKVSHGEVAVRGEAGSFSCRPHRAPLTYLGLAGQVVLSQEIQLYFGEFHSLRQRPYHY